MLKILTDVPLKLYSTMRLGGTADFAVTARTKQDLADAEEWAEERELPVRVIGGGSNIIWRDEGFKGLLVINKIGGFKKLDEDEDTATYKIGAGETWDEIVSRLVELKLSGIECLSLIPGTVGAAPVQNIGAYGQEVSETLVEIEAYDRMEKDFVTIHGNQCDFGYRTSRFKNVDNGRFLIASITLKLSKTLAVPKTYADIDTFFKDKGISERTPRSYREAVIAVRTRKLPDPAKVANTGSFFGNPVIPKKQFDKLAKKYPGIKQKPAGWSQPPFWELPHQKIKLAAGWLVEQAGFKAVKDPATGMGLWPTQNLVFVNHRASRTQDLLDFEQRIVDKVSEKFGITLEREPELLP